MVAFKFLGVKKYEISFDVPPANRVGSNRAAMRRLIRVIWNSANWLATQARRPPPNGRYSEPALPGRRL